MNRMIHAHELFIHACSVGSMEDFKALGVAGVDDFFTNHTSEPLRFQGRSVMQDMGMLLCRHDC